MRIVGQLGREDWIEAGLELLARGGPSALRVGAAARRLAVTRGSFYCHFRDRAAWRDALLAYWEHLCFAELVLGRRAPEGRDAAEGPDRQSAGGDLSLAGGVPDGTGAAARGPGACRQGEAAPAPDPQPCVTGPSVCGRPQGGVVANLSTAGQVPGRAGLSAPERGGWVRGRHEIVESHDRRSPGEDLPIVGEVPDGTGAAALAQGGRAPEGRAVADGAGLAALERAFRQWAQEDAQVGRAMARIAAERRLGVRGAVRRAPAARMITNECSVWRGQRKEAVIIRDALPAEGGKVGFQAFGADAHHAQPRGMGRAGAGQGILNREGGVGGQLQQAQGFQIGQRVGLAARQVGARDDDRDPVGQRQLVQRGLNVAAR
ncbi:hypothetical protein B6K69_02825 [Fuscovulum blasticum]|nr:hypothetical protein B6K69_02825 [Fuscovulum blasticum]